MKRQKATRILGVGTALLLAGSASADILLAGWDAGVKNWQGVGSTQPADSSAVDITGTVGFSSTSGSISGDWNLQGAGSRDGTFGNFAGARTSNPANSALEANNAKVVGAYADYTITNTGSQDYELAAFHFDAWRSYANNGQAKVEVLAGGGITAGDLGAPGVAVQNGFPDASTADYEDFDLSLAGLADKILAAGEGATFRITVIDNTQLNLDNVAVTAIPEPATLGLIGLASGFCLLIRRIHI